MNSRIAIEHHLKTLRAPLEHWQVSRRVPPVLLLTGQAGVGKRAIARFVARILLCSAFFEQPLKILPCDKCSTCTRQAIDQTEIVPDESGTLKIDQFRDLKSSSGFGSVEGQFKVILIPQIEKMTHQAANSVLKLLEEPPKTWIFILTATDLSRVLPTLTSRCQTFRLKPFSQPELEELIREVEPQVAPERCKAIADIAQGSWEKAIQYLDDAFWSKREELLQFLKDPVVSLSSLLEWASQGDSESEFCLNFLEAYIAKQMYDSYHHPSSPNMDNERSTWFKRAEKIASARQNLHLPVNRKILIQDVLLSFTY